MVVIDLLSALMLLLIILITGLLVIVRCGSNAKGGSSSEYLSQPGTYTLGRQR